MTFAPVSPDGHHPDTPDRINLWLSVRLLWAEAPDAARTGGHFGGLDKIARDRRHQQATAEWPAGLCRRAVFLRAGGCHLNLVCAAL